MNFFEHQELARKHTRKLIVFFALSVILILITLILVVTTVMDVFIYKSSWILPAVSGAASAGSYFDYLFERHSKTILVTTIVTLVVIGGAMMLRLLRLAKGGSEVAKMVGARRVSSSSSDYKEKRLVNIVEEIAIAAGVPRPGIYLMEEEHGINAFAAGYSTNSAIVAVTQGTLDTLNRDELQGVIAHEFSHVLNGDMRLNIRMLGVLAGILLIGNAGLFMLRSMGYAGYRSRDSRGGAVIVVAGLAITLVGFVGVLFGRLIQSGVSRQREYLADASAVQFTRNPNGIADALNKIRRTVEGSHVQNRHASEMNHMYFGESVRIRFFSNWFASHPPLDDRIKRIQPNYNFSHDGMIAPDQQAETDGQSQAGMAGLAGNVANNAGEYSDIASSASVSAFTIAAAEKISRQTSVEKMVADVGSLGREQILYGARLRATFSQSVNDALATDDGAVAILYVLVLDQNKNTRERQINLISESESAPLAKITLQLFDEITALGERYRWPLLELCLPNIAQLDSGRLSVVKLTLRELITFDGKMDFGEFVVLLATESLLASYTSRSTRYKFRQLSALKSEVVAILGLLAKASGGDRADQQLAFSDAAALCGFKAIELPEISGSSFASYSQAISKLRQLVPVKKQKVFEACVQIALRDKVINIKEEELLRILAGAFECPMPPGGSSDFA